MNLQSKVGYCMTTQTLNIALCKRDGMAHRQTDKQTDGRTDKRTIQTVDAPAGPFRPGHNKDISIKIRDISISNRDIYHK